MEVIQSVKNVMSVESVISVASVKLIRRTVQQFLTVERY